ncbi:TasA family protein [Nocardioides sp. Root240]|nr:TasA family protein [Nocardioides sp. Root240]
MSRKILVPLATLSAAAAVAVGSGATFTSTSGNTISAATSGTLTQLNSKDGGAIFDLTNMKPGDTLNGALNLTNTGSLPATFSLTETGSTNGFTADNLSLAITNTTTGATVYSGTFGGLVDGTKTDLGVIQPGVLNNFKFTVKLAQTAPNADQGKSATATYTWDSVQLNGTTTNQ